VKKLLNNPIAVGILVLAALVAGFWPQIESSFAAPRRRPAPPVTAAEIVAAEVATPGDAASLSRQIRQIFDKNSFAPSGRNLFAYQDEKVIVAAPVEKPAVVATQTVRLAAIWLQAGVSLAQLDHQIATTGDEIGFIRVAEISPDGVWLVQQGARVFLQLGEQHTFEQSTEPSAPAPHEK